MKLILRYLQRSSIKIELPNNIEKEKILEKKQ